MRPPLPILRQSARRTERHQHFTRLERVDGNRPEVADWHRLSGVADNFDRFHLSGCFLSLAVFDVFEFDAVHNLGWLDLHVAAKHHHEFVASQLRETFALCLFGSVAEIPDHSV